MATIKRMVIQGFKSFAKRTEVLFDTGINIIIGPNGSGKSNISDALCFVLGRLSIKSMRAAKAKNLIFMGSKLQKPSAEASVELVFGNEDRAFVDQGDEVALKRIVRRNGQSVYKINGETKTRAEVVELLAHAGIDPHGYNLVLQGQIQAIVKMHPEERRKIIEEVAGIAIYESRKEKSLRELEKTEERLKEISAVLRERTAYLRNLEEERKQALRFKELELTVKRAKATMLEKRMEAKQKEIAGLMKSMEEKSGQKEKMRATIDALGKEQEEMSQNIQKLNREVQAATGVEQDELHDRVVEVKAALEGLRVRKESQEHRQEEVEQRVGELQKGIPDLENEIFSLRTQAPGMAAKAEALSGKKKELAVLEEKRKALGLVRGHLEAARAMLEDKEKRLAGLMAQSERLIAELESLGGSGFEHEAAATKAAEKTRKSLELLESNLEDLSEERLEQERVVSGARATMRVAEEQWAKVQEIETCPLCQTTMTDAHKAHVRQDKEQRVAEGEHQERSAKQRLEELGNEKRAFLDRREALREDLKRADVAVIALRAEQEKQAGVRAVVEEEKGLREEIRGLREQIASLEAKRGGATALDEQYHTKLLEIEELSSRTAEDVDTTLLYKERELENMRNVVKRGKEDIQEIVALLGSLEKSIGEKEEELAKLEEKEEELAKRFKHLFAERDRLQDRLQELGGVSQEEQGSLKQIEEQVHYLKVGKAKFDAELEALQMDRQDFGQVELLSGSLLHVEERLRKSQEALGKIGSINMRALEVYEGVRTEYDRVQEKVNTLVSEKEEILKIIAEIDAKKKRTFMKTFTAMNELFSANFAKLSSKGKAYLEIENKENLFAGGVSIVVRLAKGKYFDVTSLSGGEQTLVALSLLFAIQEHKPYHFYVFDEIDAALDKRNSERLAGLLRQYMKKGQYIVVTHNDALILRAETLYGVSMHEGVSKILSLRVEGEKS